MHYLILAKKCGVILGIRMIKLHLKNGRFLTPEALVEDTVEIAIQVNGKLKEQGCNQH